MKMNKINRDLTKLKAKSSPKVKSHNLKALKKDKVASSYLKQFNKKEITKRNKYLAIILSSILCLSLISGGVFYLFSTGKVSLDDYKYSVEYYGEVKEITLKSQNVTLEKVLDEFDFNEIDKIKVNEKVINAKDFDMAVSTKDAIKIIKVSIETETIKRVIEYEVIEKDEPTIKRGNTIVAQNGEDGEEEVEVTRYYENGKLVSEEEKTLNSKASVNQLVLVGSGNQTTYTGPVDNGANNSGGAYDDYNKPTDDYNDQDHNPGGVPYTEEECTITINGVEHKC